MTDPNWKCSKWNIQIEWETCETTFEPLSVIAADDPITMQNRKTYIILMDGKDLDVSSKRRNSSAEP